MNPIISETRTLSKIVTSINGGAYSGQVNNGTVTYIYSSSMLEDLSIASVTTY